ncbi:ribosomal L6 family protein [Candidatus Endolissoclinum faulkneri L2]|uniref:Large ribosomal subunit protein uL6 n=1 Tax=Candidatus Endolissoclinum faulkneri L2 TaxID=1193729 RepID=K7Z391_9PROT|nr:50S ribosomal protein L6 [Candidatus Endolissoclinum faulkneri]AFX98423.1 ribosomal L6 family protein [Candidatus Endolissoclinum faulkneri L2]
MSRVGKYPIAIPANVNIEITNKEVKAVGTLGALSAPILPQVNVVREDNLVKLTPKRNTKRARAMWGTTRSLVNNIIVGVSTGYNVDLEINGVGYRATIMDANLELALGFSHSVRLFIPKGITIRCERATTISISGADKQLVGQFAAEIRACRPPEPFKGKGIKYANEVILIKEGKKK